ncbi:MAG: sel1 repeat family protein, partial [Sulfurimonas sp.]|nr:sel1 repeat family protein [Sulfurimonas sp.]
MIKQAHEAYNGGDFKTALELYTQLASEENPDALTSLAFMHQNAQGCEKDDAKALSYYKRAAELKQPYALFNLAILYMNGLGGVQHDQFK